MIDQLLAAVQGPPSIMRDAPSDESKLPQPFGYLADGLLGWTEDAVRAYAAAEVAKERKRLMAPLFDGMTVYKALDKRADKRTGYENVSDVLDAVVRVLRRQHD